MNFGNLEDMVVVNLIEARALGELNGRK